MRKICSNFRFSRIAQYSIFCYLLIHFFTFLYERYNLVLFWEWLPLLLAYDYSCLKVTRSLCLGKHQIFPLEFCSVQKAYYMCMYICIVTKKAITASECSNQSTDASIWCSTAALLVLSHKCYNTSDLSFHGSLVWLLEAQVLFYFEWLVVNWREVAVSIVEFWLREVALRSNGLCDRRQYGLLR